MSELLVSVGGWLNASEEVVIRKSPEQDAGYWVGAPGALYDPVSQLYYLYYRLRRPRGMGRGYAARVAVSRDGFHFDDVWSVQQSELGSPSIERGCLVRRGDEWLLYLSYVNGKADQWQIDMVKARRVEELDVRQARPILTPADVKGHAVKDPFIIKVGPLWYMYVSYAPLELLTRETPANLHASQDVFTTGMVRSHTGLAVSFDGERYEWLGEVLGSSPSGWDSLVSRLSGLIPVPGGYLGFYDGAASVAENYEERGGVAITGDLRTFYKIPGEAPFYQSRYGSLRYVCPVQGPEGIIVYYEAATSTGAHDLAARRLEWV